MNCAQSKLGVWRLKKASSKVSFCQSSEVKRNGTRIIHPVDEHGHSSWSVQRYRCEEYEKTVTLRRQKRRRHSWQFAVELARRHVEDRVSYRVLAKRCREKFGVKIGATTVQRLVLEVAEQCKTPAEMSRELGLET